MIFTVQEIKGWSNYMKLESGQWVPCRPTNVCLIARVRSAWNVLTGRYDALDWEAGDRGHTL